MRVLSKIWPLVLALLCAALPARAELQKIKMTITSVAATSAPYFIAIHKGYFAEQGLEVAIVNAGGGVAIPALISGSVDFSMSAAVSVGASMRGAALRVIYTMADRPAYQLWTIDPNIKTLTDMKGKQVGIISRGDTFEIAMRIMLRDAGLPLDYVGFTALGPGNSPRQAALASGSLPAVIITSGDATVFETNPLYAKAHLLADMEKAIRMPYTGIATTQKHIQQDRALVKHFLHAMVRGIAYMRAFKDETVAVMAKADPTVDPAVFAADREDLLPTMTADGTAPDALIQKDLEVRAALMDIDVSKIPPHGQIYDYGPLREVQAEIKASGWKPTR